MQPEPSKTDEYLLKISKDISNIQGLIDKSLNPAYMTRFLQGVVGGFGTVIGATIFVALFILVLTQLAHIDFLKPLVDRIIDIIQSKK